MTKIKFCGLSRPYDIAAANEVKLEYIGKLRLFTGKPIIKAFRIQAKKDVFAAENSTADAVLLDSGAGTGSYLTGHCCGE